MPFQSEAQRRYLWANEPEIARDWADTYGSRIKKDDGGIMRTGFFTAGLAAGDDISPGTDTATGGARDRSQQGDMTIKGYQQTKGDYLDKKLKEKQKKLIEIKTKEKEPSFFTKLKDKHNAKRRLDFYKKYMKQNPQFFSNPLFNKELAGLEDWESWDEEKWNDPTTRSMLDKLGYLNTGNMNQGGGGGGYRGYPSYEAWLAAQNRGQGDVTETEVIEEEPISDFQQSIAGGPDLAFKDYYVGGDPTAANIAWGKDRVDPRTMGMTSFAANGGRIPAAFGGIMDTATGRRGYFLGSIGKAFGSIAKAAKKVFKSDLGKAALLGVGAMYGAGLGPWSSGGMWEGAGGSGFLRGKTLDKLFMKNLAAKNEAARYTGSKRALSLGKLATWLSPALAFTGLGKVPGDTEEAFDHDLLRDQYAQELLRIKKEANERSLDPNEWNYLGVPEDELPFKDGGRTGYYAGGQSTPSDYTMEDAMMTTTQDKLGGITDVMKHADLYRQGSVGQFYAAQGGRIRAQEGGLMDLGGMEKDYRQEGGFVPLGGEEKADDVPARLSKNEFVFTADAVRAAGGGDIDQGAEVMENVMKNLEQGGQVSEETQGLAGAREMFGVSERLSEVV